MKENMFLKVTGIIMIVGGGLGILISLLAWVGIGALPGVFASAMLFYIFALLISTAASVIQLVAGILGVKNCALPSRASSCVAFGIVVIALNVLGCIIPAAIGLGIDFVSLFIGSVLPVLYLIAAIQTINRKSDSDIML